MYINILNFSDVLVRLGHRIIYDANLDFHRKFFVYHKYSKILSPLFKKIFKKLFLDHILWAEGRSEMRGDAKKNRWMVKRKWERGKERQDGKVKVKKNL